MFKVRHSLLSLCTYVGVVFCLAPNAIAQQCSACSDDRVAETQVSFPVTLSDGQSYQIAGFIYRSNGGFGGGDDDGRPLQVVVHGALYDHTYWDVPDVDGESYSYARHMAQRGYTVLAIDELGTGASSQPNGDFLNMAETASGLHQVLASLRTDRNPFHHPVREIALIGHSNGSITSVFESATYHDADALVTTAWEHGAHPSNIDPSVFGPLFAAPYVPPQILPEAARTALFYYTPSTDPAMLDLDFNTLASTLSRGQFGDLVTTVFAPTSDNVANVTGPVLVQVGDFDAIAPSAYAANEASFYTHASSVTLQYLTQIGHNVNAHRNHLQSWTGIDQWLGQTFNRGDHRGDQH